MGAQLIGVDVGGTKLAIATLDGGRHELRDVTPTAAGDTGALLDEIAGAVEGVRSRDTRAVGVGVPAVVDFATGTAKWSENVQLEDVPLRRLLEERLGLPVFVDNDANCAAFAEAHDGARMAVENLVMLTVGTGIGGGLVLGGRIYRGAGGAGELGQTLIGARLEDGAPAAGAFPQRGSLEALASGRSLDALAEASAREHPDSALGLILSAGAPVRGRDAVEAARSGDDRARALVTLIGERLGVGIGNAINTFDPEAVVIGGGVAGAGDLLLGPARESARRFVVKGAGAATEIRVARYGAEAGVRGAALLAGQELDATG
jgi:glucokinase